MNKQFQLLFMALAVIFSVTLCLMMFEPTVSKNLDLTRVGIALLILSVTPWVILIHKTFKQ